MAQIRTFKELKVWQKAHESVEEKFGLVTQMRRAAVSIASNIVEGFRRRSLKGSLNFYNIADGSLEELKYQLLLSFDLKFIPLDKFDKTNSLVEEVGRMLCHWTQSQKKRLK